jgi:hypothetical protein
MRAGTGDHGASLRSSVSKRGAQTARILDRLGDGAGDVRCHLDHRLQELSLDPPLVRRRFGHLVETRDELVALLVEQLELLLDAQAEGRALPEVDLDG